MSRRRPTVSADAAPSAARPNRALAVLTPASNPLATVAVSQDGAGCLSGLLRNHLTAALSTRHPASLRSDGSRSIGRVFTIIGIRRMTNHLDGHACRMMVYCLHASSSAAPLGPRKSLRLAARSIVNMKSTDTRSLAPELVALIHHVELSEAGWYDQLLDQLLLSLLYLDDSRCKLDDLKAGLQSNLGFVADEATLRKSISRLKRSGKLAETNDRRFGLTDLAMRETQAAVTENDSLDERVSQRFKALVRDELDGIDPSECWNTFCTDCLDPLITKLGARTYELIATPEGHTREVYSIDSCTEKYPISIRKKLHTVIDRFLDPEDHDVRNFVLNRLHCYLLTLTVSLPEESLSRLSTKSKSNIHLKLFLDTNFMFSLLDLHEHPANPIAKDLTKLLDNISNHVHSKLYVFPPTIDEANRTISAVHRELGDIEIPPRLGRITTATMRSTVSGIEGRYLRAASTSSYTLSADQYLAPYLNDFISVLRGVNVDIFNENIDLIMESDDVIDDIQDVQDFQTERPWERQKSFEAIRHDVALWHFVSRKRHVRVDSPLDAVYWVVTVDHNLIRFDRHKVVHRNEMSVPICVHPATLIQMLRLWTPRTESFDTAMLHCVRSLLPQARETDTEAVTLKILRSISRFERADQLPEATVSSVLLNQAVRAGMEGVTGPIEQNQLVREALLDELKSAKTEIDSVRTREAETDAKLRQVLSRNQELVELHKQDKESMDRLELELRDERKWRGELASQIDQIKQDHDKKRTDHDALLQRIARIIFSALAVVSAPIITVNLVLCSDFVGRLIGYQGHRSTFVGVVAGCCIWAFLMKNIGERVHWIRSWKVFQWFLSKKKSVLALLGASAVSIVSKLVWEYW